MLRSHSKLLSNCGHAHFLLYSVESSELFGLASKTAEVEVDRSYIEQGFFCHRKASLELKNPRMTQKRKTEKEPEEQTGTMGKASREVKAIDEKRVLWRWLRGVAGINLTCCKNFPTCLFIVFFLTLTSFSIV